jgi:uncharacterized protein YdeI (YjbR/CyaY-like superfamily)
MIASRRPRYFESPADFRSWLEKHHATARELWVGFHKKSSGKPSLTWPESVDEALCFGWIDGIRYSVDTERYRIRFSPRRPDSHWSSVNLRRARALLRQGRMRPAGLKALRRGSAARRTGYSYENRPATLPPRYLKQLKANRKAWRFYEGQPPWYRRTATWWILSAKQEPTRLRRLTRLIQHSEREEPIPPLTRRPKADKDAS